MSIRVLFFLVVLALLTLSVSEAKRRKERRSIRRPTCPILTNPRECPKKSRAKKITFRGCRYLLCLSPRRRTWFWHGADKVKCPRGFRISFTRFIRIPFCVQRRRQRQRWRGRERKKPRRDGRRRLRRHRRRRSGRRACKRKSKVNARNYKQQCSKRHRRCVSIFRGRLDRCYKAFRVCGYKQRRSARGRRGCRRTFMRCSKGYRKFCAVMRRNCLSHYKRKFKKAGGGRRRRVVRRIRKRHWDVRQCPKILLRCQGKKSAYCRFAFRACRRHYVNKRAACHRRFLMCRRRRGKRRGCRFALRRCLKTVSRKN